MHRRTLAFLLLAPFVNGKAMAQYNDKEMTDLIYFILGRVAADPKNASMRLAVNGQSAQVGQRKLQLKAFNEDQRTVSGRHVAGLRMEVAIDDLPQPNLTSGAVGIGSTLEEAQKVAASEWYLQFGSMMISAVADSRPEFRLEKYAVYVSPVGLRLRPGHSPTQQPADLPTARQLITALSSLMPIRDGAVHTVAMTLVFDAKGQVNGEIRIDGQVAEKALAAIRQLRWPVGESLPLMYKQAFFLR